MYIFDTAFLALIVTGIFLGYYKKKKTTVSFVLIGIAFLIIALKSLLSNQGTLTICTQLGLAGLAFFASYKNFRKNKHNT